MGISGIGGAAGYAQMHSVQRSQSNVAAAAAQPAKTTTAPPAASSSQVSTQHASAVNSASSAGAGLKVGGKIDTFA